MVTQMAVCPDGQERAYTVSGDIAIVQVRGYQVEGKVTVNDGVTKFRQRAHHHGAHLVWHPPPPHAPPHLVSNLTYGGTLIASASLVVLERCRSDRPTGR